MQSYYGFQFLILGYKEANLESWRFSIFQFLILGYNQWAAANNQDMNNLSIPHFRIRVECSP